MTDKPSASARWWNWRHILLGTILLLDVIYIVLMSGLLIGSGRDRVLPPQVSQIFVGTLGVATVLAGCVLLAGKIYDKIERLQCRQDTQFAILAAQAAELKSLLEAHRASEEKTVPLAGAAQRVVYASAAVASVRASQPGPPAEGLVQAVVDGLAEHVEEFGQRKYWRGVAGCAKVGLDGVAQDADVVPLQSVRGMRSQPPA